MTAPPADSCDPSSALFEGSSSPSCVCSAKDGCANETDADTVSVNHRLDSRIISKAQRSSDTAKGVPQSCKKTAADLGGNGDRDQALLARLLALVRRLLLARTCTRASDHNESRMADRKRHTTTVADGSHVVEMRPSAWLLTLRGGGATLSDERLHGLLRGASLGRHRHRVDLCGCTTKHRASMRCGSRASRDATSASKQKRRATEENEAGNRCGIPNSYWRTSL